MSAVRASRSYPRLVVVFPARTHRYCSADCVTFTAQYAGVFTTVYVQDGAEVEPLAVLSVLK